MGEFQEEGFPQWLASFVLFAWKSVIVRESLPKIATSLAIATRV